MKFSLIIPTYNRYKVVKEAVNHSVNKCGISRTNIELIWVDDGSTEPEVHHIMRELNPEICILKKLNEGTIKTKNKGLLLSTYEWIVVMDSDFKMEVNWLKTLSEYINIAPEFKLIALSDLNKDRWIGDLILNKGKYKIYKMKVPLISGAFAFHRKILQYVGFLDEEFGFYGLNDAEWTGRVKKAGFKFCYTNISGEHIGNRGEKGENREKKDRSLKINGGLFRKKAAEPRVYYNPIMDSYLNEVLDERIRKDIASGTLDR